MCVGVASWSAPQDLIICTTFPCIRINSVNMLAQLEDDSLRSIARMRLEGYSNEEIGNQLSISSATVKRRLSIIRETWS